jgi:hypothetical protein
MLKLRHEQLWNRSPSVACDTSVETKGGAELADLCRLGAVRKAVPIFIGAVMRSIRAAEETGFYRMTFTVQLRK